MTAGRIAVFGAGAIGGYVGAKLAASGEDVVFVDVARDHVRAIRENGLRVRGAVDLHVRAPALHPSELEISLETVLLAVKARHTEEALAEIAPRLTESGCIVSLQNGIEEPRIACHVGAERTIGAFLTFGGHYVSPGEIVFGGRGSFRIGELDGRRSNRVGELAKLLGRAHPVDITERIFGFLWGKTALEAFYFASALADADVVDILDRDELLPALGALVGEVARVAEAEGTRCERIDGFDPNAFAATDAPAAEANWLAQRRYWQGHVAQRTGIWRDLFVHARPTEVDAIFGPVLEAADRRGIATPRLRCLVALVHEAEVGGPALGFSALESLSAYG